jgi:hypothetical protein
MKLKRKAIPAFVAFLLVSGLFIFFFYTPLGLAAQISWSRRIHEAYLRFYCSRLAAAGNPDFQHPAALELYALGFNYLEAAHNAASAAIAQRPDPQGFRLRANIELNTLSYSNAVADFEQALNLSKGPPGFDFPSLISNHLEMAKACEAAKVKYWLSWNNRLERGSTPQSAN